MVYMSRWKAKLLKSDFQGKSEVLVLRHNTEICEKENDVIVINLPLRAQHISQYVNNNPLASTAKWYTSMISKRRKRDLNHFAFQGRL